jgi:hypothetical protein
MKRNEKENTGLVITPEMVEEALADPKRPKTTFPQMHVPSQKVRQEYWQKAIDNQSSSQKEKQ